MTRIFDALRKAHAKHPTPVPPLASVPPVAVAPGLNPGLARGVQGAATGGFAVRPVAPRLGLPLLGAAPLDEDEERQMMALRVQLESALGERSPRVVMFHGSQSGEGASTVVQQFCRALARDGDQRVLLVDMHVVRPTLRNDAELGVAICSGRPRRPSAEDAAAMPNLHGLPVPEPYRSRVYPVEAARELLDSVATGYDWVVIDGPPVLEAPDAAPLSALADGTVMVVRAGRTKRPVLARAVELLRKSGARVIGSVLNRRQLEIPEFIYRRI